MDIWGKSQPFYPLTRHLADVRAAGRLLLTPARIAAFGRVGVGRERARELIEMITWLHDFGKATREWQSAIVAGRRPPHALTSFQATLWAFGAQSCKTAPPDVLAAALAVLAHHGQLSANSFQPDRLRGQAVTLYTDAWQEMARELPIRVALQPLPQTRIDSEILCRHVEAAKRIVPELTQRYALRGLYCILLSVLVDADHAASGHIAPAPRSVGEPGLPGLPTRYQIGVQTHPSSLLCGIAGCGAGKTAAALLRAADLAEKQRVDRVVFCLPTRFTSNSLLRDMSDPQKYRYPPSQVGLIHGEAFSVLKSLAEQGDENEWPDSPEEQALRRLGIRYEHPITISTVDHLLMSMYHGYRFSDRALGALMSSLVVFDEVHAYDTTTLNAIREGMNVLESLGIPVMVMSATLPSSRRTFLGVGAGQTIIESDNPFRPFRAAPNAEPLTRSFGNSVEVNESAIALIRDSQKLKLLVYVNQVERAKALAHAARDVANQTSVFCYHSELAQRDRIMLEEEIIRAFNAAEPVIAIATQAAELSLDVSADRMLTEMAPADVLVQRAGRLHRRGREPVQAGGQGRLPDGFQFELIVAPVDLTPDHRGATPGALPYADIDLLMRTWDLAPWRQDFSFEAALAWCEAALVDAPPETRPGLAQAFINDTVFGHTPQENYGEDGDTGLVAIRDRDDASVMVLPEIYLAEIGDDLLDLPAYLVPMRNRKYHRLRQAGFIDRRTIPMILGKGMPGRERITDYPVNVVVSNVKYDPRLGGFDLQIGDETAPSAGYANNMF